MDCDIKDCGRTGLSEKELKLHKKHYHKIGVITSEGQHIPAGVCPDCGSALFYQEGCATCQSCGYSRCG